MASLRDQVQDGGYETRVAQDPDAFPEPRWPKQALAELIAASFGERLITSADHPGLKRLLGQKVQ